VSSTMAPNPIRIDGEQAGLAGAEPTRTVGVVIDGRAHDVPEGLTVLQACRALGIEIPTLCEMRDLAPDGSCRMCMVKITQRGRTAMKISCAEPVSEGMEIVTMDDEIFESRRFILDLLCSNHEFDCFRCAANSDCRLQDYSMQYRIDRTDFPDGRFIGHKVDSSNPFLTFHADRCIMCRRCVRACGELQGRNVIALTQRGFDTRMSTSWEMPWELTNCESCGNCVSVCPVGALEAKDHQRGYRDWQVEDKVVTTCPHCGVGCQLELQVRGGRVVGVEPAYGPANRGILCVKGKFGSYKFASSSDRLTDPLIKENGEFRKAGWDEALDLIADRMKAIIAKDGPDAIAGFSCSRAPNEDNYMFQKMMRAAIGTNNVDNCARVCHSASVTGLATTLGSGAMTNTIRDVTHDVDAILLVGSNTTEAHPVIGAQIRAAVRAGAKLIVVDPRRTDLTSMAELHLPIRPGTDIAFANAMVNIIIANGWADEAFIAQRTEGFEALREIVAEYEPEKVARLCHIPVADLYRAAEIYAKAERAPIIYCLGVTEHTSGTQNVMSLSNLAMVVGKYGRPGCGINPLRGQNNVQGACDMGCEPHNLPGYQKFDAPGVMDKFEGVWGRALPRGIGLRATQVFGAAAEGRVKGLFIFGEDPMVTDPNTAHVRAGLEALDLLVVDELFMTPTAELADVVLPGSAYVEKEGTFSNTERRVQRVRKAVDAPGNARLDTWIFAEVMRRMGYPETLETAADIMDEIALVDPDFGGISHARLDAGESLQWPCPTRDHPGTPIMHVGAFKRGLGYFYPTEYQEPNEVPDEDYPILMSTGRMLYHYNNGAMTHRTEGLTRIASQSYIQINETDARALGIAQGDLVKVSSRRGAIETQAWVGDRVGEGEAFMTFHFPSGNPNVVANDATDPLCFIPEYKVCAIRVEKTADAPTPGRLSGLHEPALL